MSFVDHVNRADTWLLDRVFQPFADRLPERVPAVELGMSLQLGAILFYAAAVIAVTVMGHLSLFDSLFNVLIWCVGLSFYMGINRMRRLVRPGQANPLRPMLAGLRPLSIPLLVLAAWQSSVALPPLALSSWLMTLSDLIFVLGLYLISCEPRPPMRQAQTRNGRVVLLKNALAGGRFPITAER